LHHHLLCSTEESRQRKTRGEDSEERRRGVEERRREEEERERENANASRGRERGVLSGIHNGDGEATLCNYCALASPYPPTHTSSCRFFRCARPAVAAPPPVERGLGSRRERERRERGGGEERVGKSVVLGRVEKGRVLR